MKGGPKGVGGISADKGLVSGEGGSADREGGSADREGGTADAYGGLAELGVPSCDAFLSIVHKKYKREMTV